ncbi:MAG: cation:proton antiporter [Clostridia bacterium]|nr:cation:proton antiporter [Clostridia bacterium]
MLDAFYERIAATSSVAPVILSVALMLFFGFAATRITKRLRLPSVTAYLAAGILLGPYVFDLVPTEVVGGMSFLSDIALAFIAFGVGEFFKLSALRKNGWRTVAITLSEALLSSLLVFFVTYLLLGLDLSFSLVLAALASATAPASTVMTIRQTGAKGDFVDTLLQVMALDNVVSLLSYSVAISVAVAAIGGGALSFSTVAMPLLRNLLAVVVGGVLGFVLRLLIPEGRSNDNRLIIVVALLFLFCGFCSIIDVSPLLGCMMIGAVYVNLGGDDKLFLQVSYFSPPILLLFFVRSGIGFRLDSLFAGGGSLVTYPLILVSVTYFLVRTVGKVGGSYLGCLAVGKERRVRNYLGLAEIPQASVAIGLAVLGARALGGEMGQTLETVVVAAGILYEIVGPVSAKLALYLSGSYTTDLPAAPTAEGVDEVAILCERIRAIREGLGEREAPPPTPEDAFTEAALMQREAMMPRRRGRWWQA